MQGAEWHDLLTRYAAVAYEITKVSAFALPAYFIRWSGRLPVSVDTYRSRIELVISKDDG